MSNTHDDQLETIYGSSSFGEYGPFKVEIKAWCADNEVFGNEAVKIASYQAAELIQAAVMEEVIKHSARSGIERSSDRRALLAAFNDPIFVKEIPNEYCNRWCCKHLPWYLVTTKIGTFKIGKRKSVIHVEWTETTCEIEANKLFPDDPVTRFGRTIHAHTVEDVKRYVDTVLATATKETR